MGKLTQLLARAHLAMGNQHTETARRRAGPEAERYFQSAYQRYASALAGNNRLYEAAKNWGRALYFAAQTKSGKEQGNLLKQACEKLALAHDIDPNDGTTLYHWGMALAQQAARGTMKDSDERYQSAYEKFAQALTRNAQDHQPLHGWGLALYQQALSRPGPEADGVLQAAGLKYSAAARIKPDGAQILNDWGVALMERARRMTGPERDARHQEAEEKFLEAEKHHRAIGSYNLACIYSLRGDQERCREYLELARANHTLPSRAHMESDPDLGGARSLDWFHGLWK